MSDETHDLGSAPKSLDDLLAECIAAEESGRAIDADALSRQHPEHAVELRKFLANRDQMRRLAEPLQGAAAGAARRNGHALGKVRYFGDYELVQEIAAGGMGIVYKARQVSLNRVVAVKMILRGTLASEDDVKRFRAEAEAAANLQHPGIVAIHEVGLHEGQHYFSMDYVEGPNLAQLPRENPLSARQAAEYVRDAADAVHYAHQQGTLHRDLKPSNILIDRQGRVRITDFGLAKRIEGNSDLTLTGQVLGTPSYMPPEQALGKRSLIGTASDVYSLGAVLYELLTGRPPFRGESPGETLRQVETLDPVSPRLLNPTTPRDLETICLKCLEKEPHKRYLTAQHLADDLGRWFTGHEILARPASPLSRAAKWIKRRPAIAALIAASVIAAIAMTGAAVAVWYNGQLQMALSDAKVQRNKAESLLEEVESAGKVEVKLRKEKERLLAEAVAAKIAEESARKIADQNLYLYRIALADRELIAGNSSAAKDILDECPASLRHWEWHYSDRRSRGEKVVITIEAHPLEIYQVSFSPDGQWIASAGRDGQVGLWNVDDGKLVTTLKGEIGSFFGIAFSPDGSLLAAAGGDANYQRDIPGKIMVWDLASRVLKLTITGHTKGVCSVAFDRKGERLTSASFDNTVRVWDVTDGRLIQQLTSNGSQVGAYSTFSPDGKLLAVGLRSGPLTVWDATTWNRLFTANAHDGKTPGSGRWGPFRIAFSPDSRSVLSTYQSRENGIQLRDAKTGAATQTFGVRQARESRLERSHADYVYELAYSPDGRRLATSGGNGTVKIWDMSAFREVLELGHADSLFSVQFSPDGRRLAIGSGVWTGKAPGRITIWDAGIPQDRFTAAEPPMPVALRPTR